MGDFVRLEVDGGVGTIRLDRPPMNAFNARLQEELREVAIEAASHDGVRAVVVYGGEKVFAAGADITEFTTMTYQQMSLLAADLYSAFDAVAGIATAVRQTLAFRPISADGVLANEQTTDCRRP